MSDNLYSPWRFDYIQAKKATDCIFCIKPEDDVKRLVLYRSNYSFVVMNLYPYNNGHIMVVPNRHLAQLSELEAEERNDLFALVACSENIIKEKYNCDGLNVGINLGKAAGAGVDEHLHIHIVPRWFGDVNYMSSTGDIRVIPEDFNKAYKSLKELYDRICRV